MKIFKGQLSDVCNGTFTMPDFDKTVNGNYVTTYTSQNTIRESGMTKFHTKPFDLSKHYTLGINRKFTFYSHINGGNLVGAGAGSSIYIAYQVCPEKSGSSWYTVSGRLRIGGTSVSGTSGTEVTTISSPVIAPFWRLEFAVPPASHSTGDMTVDYALITE